MTDYTGVPLTDIVDHLRQWSEETGKAIATLNRQRGVVAQERTRFEFPGDILRYIDYFVDLFTRYQGDIDRVLVEISAGVREAHIEILGQILHSSDHAETRCLAFKRDHITHRLRDEQARPDLDKIYSETRSMLTDFHDLSNVIPRLKTYVGLASTVLPEVLQLKPGLWGVSIDLKETARRLRKWWQLIVKTH